MRRRTWSGGPDRAPPPPPHVATVVGSVEWSDVLWSSHYSQCRQPIPIPWQSPFSTTTMSRPEASASMTSVSSSQALNPVRACPSCSPDRRHSYSSADTRHTALPLHPQHLLVTMTLRRHQSPPDPRKHRFHLQHSYSTDKSFHTKVFLGNSVSTRAVVLLPHPSNAGLRFRHLLVAISDGPTPPPP